jgi:MerR family transcriptional regulator, thiopeptide resistance regulator
VEDGCVADYRVQEFARRAGVSVRALHHYDRLGLLRARRTASRYRLYSDTDLERLEQIVALRFLGIPLKQIGRLLDGKTKVDFAQTLRRQRSALEEKRRLLDRAIQAIRRAERHPYPELLKNIIEVIEMESNTDWMKKYSSEEAWAKIERRRELWSPELQERVSREWAELIRNVAAALDEDPGSERAQSLAARWKALVEQFTCGDPDVTQSLRNLYADQANWPADFQQQMAPFRNPKVWEFMQRAMEQMQSPR